jgi:hypothetical protein
VTSLGRVSKVASSARTAGPGASGACDRKAVDASRDALVLLDEIEDLLGEKVLNYARRAAG